MTIESLVGDIKTQDRYEARRQKIFNDVLMTYIDG